MLVLEPFAKPAKTHEQLSSLSSRTFAHVSFKEDPSTTPLDFFCPPVVFPVAKVAMLEACIL